MWDAGSLFRGPSEFEVWGGQLSVPRIALRMQIELQGQLWRECATVRLCTRTAKDAANSGGGIRHVSV
jgi:hypothetical protein